MSTNELNLTLVGWLGTEPRHYPGAPGATPFTSFRMASTRRWFDRDKGAWVDGRTEWFTVKAWRGAARNVAESLRKGDPVVVHGRLSTDEWAGPEGSRTTLVLDAIAIGPDLMYGSARYSRTMHTSGPGDETEGDAAGEPGADAAGSAAVDDGRRVDEQQVDGDGPGAAHLVAEGDLAGFDEAAVDPLALSATR